MMRIFPTLVIVSLAVAGHQAAFADQTDGIMVPGVNYDGLNSEGEPALVIFGADGIVQIQQPDDSEPERNSWHRKGGKICIGSVDKSTEFECLSEQATQVEGGFSLFSENAGMMYFEPAAE